MDAPDKAIAIRGAIAAVIAFGSALFGWVGWLIVIWAICMVLDYLSGTWAALKTGTWSSTIARQGLWHKLGSIVAVCVAALCDIAVVVVVGQLGSDLHYSGFITPVVALWYIFTELGSIAENAGKLGSPIPPWLLKMIKKLHDKVDEAGNNIDNDD